MDNECLPSRDVIQNDKCLLFVGASVPAELIFLLVKQRGFGPFLAFMLLNYILETEIEENCVGNTDEKPELRADSDNTQCYNHIRASYLSPTACTAHLCI